MDDNPATIINNSSLSTIAKGTGIGFFGVLVGTGFALLGKVIVARVGTEAEYGTYSLSFAVMSIAVVIASLGLQQGVPRNIAFARGKRDNTKIQDFISTSIQASFIASIFLAIIVFLLSDILANSVFHDANVSSPLKIFAVGIPFLSLIGGLASIFRGFDDVKPHVYFQNIMRPILFAFFLLPLILFTLPFQGVFYAFLGSVIVSAIIFVVYTIRRLPFPIQPAMTIKPSPATKELILFSLPLLGSSILVMVINWTDTLMLGAFETSTDVGLYNEAHPISVFISMPLTTLTAIYLPILSGMYSQGAMSPARKNFLILTKWLCLATMPLFLILFAFPEVVLSSLFGASYTGAADALRLLSAGFIINNYFGPNGATLIAMGKTQFVMWATLATAIINVGLNIVLIPPFGIEGAAIATVVAMISTNLLKGWKLHSLSRMHPLSKNLMKLTLVSLGLLFFFMFILANIIDVTWWILPIILVLCYAVQGATLLFAKSLDKEDVELISAIEAKMGINIGLVANVLRRFQ